MRKTREMPTDAERLDRARREPIVEARRRTEQVDPYDRPEADVWIPVPGGLEKLAIGPDVASASQPGYPIADERLPGRGALDMRRSGMAGLRRLLEEGSELRELLNNALVRSAKYLDRDHPPTRRELWDLMALCRQVMYRSMDVFNAAYGLEQHVTGVQDPSREDPDA